MVPCKLPGAGSGGGAVTTREVVTWRLTLPEPAEIVSVDLPAGVGSALPPWSVVVTVIIVVAPATVGTTDAGAKVALVPAGSPATAGVTPVANPFSAVSVNV